MPTKQVSLQGKKKVGKGQSRPEGANERDPALKSYVHQDGAGYRRLLKRIRLLLSEITPAPLEQNEKSLPGKYGPAVCVY